MRKPSVPGALAGRRAFVTGHTGFKGSWLAVWLRRLGAEVFGYALRPPTSPSHYRLVHAREALAGETMADVRDAKRLRDALLKARPDVIFHLAAQTIVRTSYRVPRETFETNVMGTVNLLEAVRSLGRPVAVVVVSTDKCYENREQMWGYRECDALGGFDPYSASKGAAELVVQSYQRAFFHPADIRRHGVRLASARAGNVIGGGDWAPDRLVCDLVRAVCAGRALRVRNPEAVRPWQHVLEPLGGYLTLAAALLKAKADTVPALASAWNFGPDASSVWTVRRVVEETLRRWGGGSWHDASQPGEPHEARLLALNCDKAWHILGWRPTWDVTRAIEAAVEWYRLWHSRGDVRALTRQQISQYMDEADWTKLRKHFADKG